MIQIIPVPGVPEIQPGDDIASRIANCLRDRACKVMHGDIFVIAQKIVSKSEGRTVDLREIIPSDRAREWASEWQKDPRIIELVLRQSRCILRMERGVIICETHHGYVCANAGVDASNTPENTAVLLPENPDESARALQLKLQEILAIPLGVIVSDSFGRAWREGLVNVALGVAGLPALIDYRGQRDGEGKLLNATVIACADELAAAAELVMGKSDRVPVAIIRGFRPDAPSGKGRNLIRPAARDLFRS